MSDFPEKENLTETPEEEFSTVFSDPAEHKTVAIKQRKKLLPVIIASVLAVAILIGGTVAVIKLIPEREEEPSASEVESFAAVYEEEEDLKNVSITNQNGDFTFYPKVTSEETSSSSATIDWYLDGYKETVIDSYSVSTVVDAAILIPSTREITQKTDAECGFDKPIISIKLIKTDGSEYSVLIGNDSPDNTGMYIKNSLNGKIYLAASDLKDTLTFDELSFAKTDSVPGITITDNIKSYTDDSGQLFSFDKLTLSGANLSEKVVIVPNDNTTLSDYSVYMTIAPTKRIADKVENILGFFRSGTTVSGAYSYKTDAAERKRLGFDKAELVATMQVGPVEKTYHFKKQSDGGYAVWYEGADLISKVEASSITFIDYGVVDYYGSWVVLQSINDVSNLTIKTPEKDYSFDIVYDDTENSEEPYVITHNGKKLTASNFQKFYEHFITLSCSDFTIDKVSADPSVTFILTYVDTAKGKTTVNFTKTSETKYQYTLDGLEMGKVNASSLNKILRLLPKVSADEKIN